MSTDSIQGMGHLVTLIPGDGIGPEVVSAACRVLEAAGVDIAWEVHEVGDPAVEHGKDPLPADVLRSIRANKLALKGPVSTSVTQGAFRSVNVGLRSQLGLFAQVRPCRSWPGVPSAFNAVDVVVIRDTTEDLYAGVEFAAGSAGAHEVIDSATRHGRGVVPREAGLSIKFVSEGACRRIIEFAVAFAREHGRTRVTVAHKATVMRCTDGILLDVAMDIAAKVSDIQIEAELVDNVCGQLVRRPERFDVLVTTNQYGDILSDVAASIVGGIGLAPGGNYGMDATLFEPAHGSAPSHAGRDDVNPVATILSGALLLDRLGEHGAAVRVREAIASVLADGRFSTYDIRRPGQPIASTTQMVDAVIELLGDN